MAFTNRAADSYPALLRVREELKLSNTHFSALFLLYESNQEQSPWRSYFDVLPKSFDTTLFWTDQELSELEGADLLHFSRTRNSMVERGYESTLGQLFKKGNALFPRDKYSLDKWKWALAILWSRGFSLPSGAGLMPFVDFFNAIAPDEPEMVKAEHNSTHMVFTAARTIPPNTQILVPYGKYSLLSNAQLLMDYGFVFADNSLGNTIFLPFRLESRVDDHTAKLQILKKAGLKRENNFPISLKQAVDGLPKSLLCSFKIAAMTPREVRRATELEDIDDVQISEYTEIKFRRQILALASTLLRGYKTSLETDQQLLRGALPYRMRMAVQVRMEEKTILRAMIDNLQKEIDELLVKQKNIL